MRTPDISLASLDGLNNNGKSTQLRFIKQELIARGIPAVIRKGDGSRKGRGLEEVDPYSEWWQTNHDRIKSIGLDEARAYDAATIANRQLMREVLDLKRHDFPEVLQEQGADKGAILLDRGPISRMFVSRRYKPDVTFAEAMGIEEDPAFTGAIPERIVVLHAAKHVLLERNESRQEGGIEKRAFNRQIISDYYDDFSRLLSNLPPELEERTTILDSDGPVQEVGNTALQIIVGAHGS